MSGETSKRKGPSVKYPLADNIRTIREKQDMQQIALAEKLGVKRERVSNWECAENNPLPEWIPLIADALHCSIDELFNHQPKMTEAQWKLVGMFDDLDDHDIETLLVTAEAMRQRHQ